MRRTLFCIVNRWSRQKTNLVEKMANTDFHLLLFEFQSNHDGAGLVSFQRKADVSGMQDFSLRSGMMMLRGCMVDFYKKHEVCGYACCSLAWAFKETEMLQGMASKDHEERRRRRIRCILII